MLRKDKAKHQKRSLKFPHELLGPWVKRAAICTFWWAVLVAMIIGQINECLGTGKTNVATLWEPGLCSASVPRMTFSTTKRPHTKDSKDMGNIEATQLPSHICQIKKNIPSHFQSFKEIFDLFHYFHVQLFFAIICQPSQKNIRRLSVDPPQGHQG